GTEYGACARSMAHDDAHRRERAPQPASLRTLCRDSPAGRCRVRSRQRRNCGNLQSPWQGVAARAPGARPAPWLAVRTNALERSVRGARQNRCVSRGELRSSFRPTRIETCECCLATDADALARAAVIAYAISVIAQSLLGGGAGCRRLAVLAGWR